MDRQLGIMGTMIVFLLLMIWVSLQYMSDDLIRIRFAMRVANQKPEVPEPGYATRRKETSDE